MDDASSERAPGIFPAPWETSGTDLGTDTGTATDPPDTTTTTVAVGTPTAEDDTRWWWALPGAAVGAVLALALRAVAPRMPWGRLRRDPGPRQELRDV